MCVCANVYICVYVNQRARAQSRHFLSTGAGGNTFSKAAPLQIEHTGSITTITMDS